jgi:SAM-dependent methyltransferase
MICRICDYGGGNEEYNAREMMYGTGESFLYFKCSRCGTLQISDIPPDISKYYLPDYYSFSHEGAQESGLRLYLIKLRDNYGVFKKGITGRILFSLFPDYLIGIYSEFSTSSSILDVGCGTGKLIKRLKKIGFENVTGIDPFISETKRFPDGLLIEKKTINEISGKWDMITYHHVFEHVADPLSELKKVYELLKNKGLCVIRVPNVDSLAWDNYRTDWVQLDAPRHLFLYSIQSFFFLAEKAGLKVENVEYDSTAFQFWGSEQIRQNIPLKDPVSYAMDPRKSMFTRKQMKDFERRSKECNDQKTGDQVIYFLRK